MVARLNFFLPPQTWCLSLIWIYSRTILIHIGLYYRRQMQAIEVADVLAANTCLPHLARLLKQISMHF